MTTSKHICFTCENFYTSLAMVSSKSGEPFLIGDCMFYCGKNSGERKTCKLYHKAEEHQIQIRKEMLEDAKNWYNSWLSLFLISGEEKLRKLFLVSVIKDMDRGSNNFIGGIIYAYCLLVKIIKQKNLIIMTQMIWVMNNIVEYVK